MAKRLFSYPFDAEDEAESVCQELEAQNIEYYVTPGSRWGFSQPTIWLRNDADYEKAKTLLSEHAEKYAQRARLSYQQETGYKPDAPLPEKFIFLLHFWRQRKLIVLASLLGLGIIGVYFVLFFRSLINI